MSMRAEALHFPFLSSVCPPFLPSFTSFLQFLSSLSFLLPLLHFTSFPHFTFSHHFLPFPPLFHFTSFTPFLPSVHFLPSPCSKCFHYQKSGGVDIYFDNPGVPQRPMSVNRNRNRNQGLFPRPWIPVCSLLFPVRNIHTLRTSAVGNIRTVRTSSVRSIIITQ